MKKALLVDLGNVLVRFDHRHTARCLSSATGRDEEALLEALHGTEEAAYDAGLIARSGFFRAVERRASLPELADDLWVPAWRDIFEPLPGALDLVASARASARVALVSNTNELHWEGVKRVVDLDGRFDAIVLSFEVGACKPGAAIFRAALAAIGASPGEAVFADDRPEHLAGAAALGIDGILVRAPGDLAAGLRRHGLLPPNAAP